MTVTRPRYYRRNAGTFNEQIWDSWLHLVWWTLPHKDGSRPVIYGIASVNLKGWEPL